MFKFKRKFVLVLSSFLPLIGCGVQVDQERVQSVYAQVEATSKEPLNVYHLGHSLVNRDMPLMLQQLAGDGHEFSSQIGWGTPLRDHWEPDYPINGFEQENDHPNYRDAMDSIASGDFDAFVLTEMVEIQDAIKYFDTSKYLAKFVEKISEHNSQAPIYFYESWTNYESDEQWFARLEQDLSKFWETEIIDPALALTDYQKPIWVVPVGRCLSAFFKEASTRGMEVQPTDILGRGEDGALDTIHFGDVGNYFVALVHYAVLYKQSPVGLPRELSRLDGSIYTSPSEEIAELMQEVIWSVVTSYPRTGVMK